MLISVVVPTHQRPQGLKDLLRSLADQEFDLEQLEIHLVGNFQDDPSSRVTEFFRGTFKNIHWHFVGEQGANRARNLGLKCARGEIVAFFDDDCVLPHRHFLSELVKAHASHPNATAIGGGYFTPADAGAADIAYNRTAEVWLSRVAEETGKCVNLVGGNVSYKRALLNEGGFEFNSDIVFGGAETEMHLRLFKAGHELRYLENLRIEHRTHIGGLELLRKGFAQGMASQMRWNTGLHVTTRTPESTVFAPLPWPARFWKESFDRAFALGCASQRDRQRPVRFNWGLRLFVRGLLSFVRHEIQGWRFERAQRDQSVSLPLQRFYVLPVSNSCKHTCSYCTALGCKKTSPEPVEVQLQKAKMYGYSEILLPCNASFAPDMESIVKKIEEAGLRPSLLVNGDASTSIDLRRIHYLFPQIGYHLLVGVASAYQDGVIRFLEKHARSFTATYFHWNRRRGLKILKSLPPSIANRMHYLFSASGAAGKPRPTTVEIHKFLVKARQRARKSYNMHLRGPAGYWPVQRADEYDDKVYPVLQSMWSSGHRREDSPEISVIIPSFDAGSHLVKVLNSLRSQSIPGDRFEVLVMDDGSRDGTLAMLKAQEEYPFHLRYYYWPRDPARKTPEFRAGLIRNLGVTKSRGKFLCFLDSDVLVGPDYLKNIEQLSEYYDVIQARRDMLTRSASQRTTGYENFAADDIYPDEPYWEKFKALHEWTEAPQHWKYTCTYALSMRKNLFIKAGWFSPEFFCYGFEDVDLGYRMFKLGARFHLSQATVFHLYPERAQHNYHFDVGQRDIALTQSSNVFFRNRLDPVIFVEFYPGYYQPMYLKLSKPYYFLRYQIRKRILGISTPVVVSHPAEPELDKSQALNGPRTFPRPQLEAAVLHGATND